MNPEGPDRRRWPRIPASLLGQVSAAIVSGPDVKLLNLSRGGALLEVAARYPMRAYIRLRLTRPTGEVTLVPATVLWAKVAAIVDGQIIYHSAIIFEREIDLAAAAGIQETNAEAALPSATIDAAASAGHPPVGAFPIADHQTSPQSTRNNLSHFPAAAAASSALEPSSSRSLNSPESPQGVPSSGRDALPREWEREKSKLLSDLAEAIARAGASEAALTAREQEFALTLADERRKHEALMAELVKAANDQQAEYQQLLAEARGANEEVLMLAERQRAALEVRVREMQATIDGLVASHERRNELLRTQAQALMSTLASSLEPASVPAATNPSHAVA